MTWQRTVVRLFPPQTVQLPNDGAAVGIQNMDGGMYFFFKYYDGPITPLCSTYQSNHAPSSPPNRQTTSTLFVASSCTHHACIVFLVLF